MLCGLGCSSTFSGVASGCIRASKGFLTGVSASPGNSTSSDSCFIKTASATLHAFLKFVVRSLLDLRKPECSSPHMVCAGLSQATCDAKAKPQNVPLTGTTI